MNTRALQIRLAELGYDPGPIGCRFDGVMGRKTIAAIKAFQTAKGLKVDGIVGPVTRGALEIPAAVVQTGGNTHAALTVSPVCIDLIKAWEGIEDGDKRTVNLEPYVDPVGIYTLGWGHALTDERGQFIRTSGAAAAWMERNFGKSAITRDEAKALLSMDVNAFTERLVPLLRGVPIVQSEVDAVVSLAFNIGARGFSGSTVLKRHKARVPVSASVDFRAAIAASRSGSVSGPMERAFGGWSNSAGRWMLGLFRRRMCEALIYRGDALAGALAASQAIRA